MIGLETPINIDLRELTPEILNICEPHLGKGEYDAPCLIGALMNVDDRSYVASLAEADDGFARDAVGYFIEQGIITVPEEQFDDVIDIQLAFDRSRWAQVLEIASKYMPSTEETNNV